MARMFTEGFSLDIEGMEVAEVLAKKGIQVNLEKAVDRAIMSTLKFTAQMIPKEISKHYYITPTSLRAVKGFGVNIIPPSTTPAAWGGGGNSGRVEVTGTRIPVMKFNVNPTAVPNQRGIPVSARQVISVKLAENAGHIGHPNRFLAEMPTGHIGVFLRKPGSTHRVRPDGQRTQLPIMEEFMVSPPEMVKSERLAPVIQMKMRNYFETAFKREASRGLTGRFR